MGGLLSVKHFFSPLLGKGLRNKSATACNVLVGSLRPYLRLSHHPRWEFPCSVRSYVLVLCASMLARGGAAEPTSSFVQWSSIHTMSGLSRILPANGTGPSAVIAVPDCGSASSRLLPPTPAPWTPVGSNEDRGTMYYWLLQSQATAPAPAQQPLAGWFPPLYTCLCTSVDLLCCARVHQ